MNLYLVRHPRPCGARGLCYGRRDLSITPDSLHQAAASVRGRLDAPLLSRSTVFSSPATRCVLLARELAAPRAPVLVDDLRELDFGSWEGLEWDAVPRKELQAWADDVWSYRPGGAESAALVADRWLRWTAELRTSGIDTAVVVTHAGVIRVAQRCCGVLNAAEFPRAAIDYGSVHRIELADSRLPA